MKQWFVGSLARWRYQLEKGQPHLIVFLMLLVIMAVLIPGGGIVLWAGGESGSVWDAMWSVFLHLSDPGYLGEDHGPLQIIVGIFMTIAGVVVFTSGIIAIATNLLSEFLEDLAQGGHDVAFDGHIVVVGWSEKVYSLVAELLQADGGNEIAILAHLAKPEAEHLLESRVFGPLTGALSPSALDRLAVWTDPRRSVVYRRGSPMVEADLQRVGAGRARRFILLSPEGGHGLANDVQMLRRYLTVRRQRLSAPDVDTFSCVVEITENRLREHVFLAANLDPRADAWVAQAIARDPSRHQALPDLPPLTGPRREDLTLVNSDELITRALVQCAVQPRISGVYDTLLSFEGRDLTIVSSDDLAGILRGRSLAVWQQLEARIAAGGDGAVPDSMVLAEIDRHLDNGLVLGAVVPDAEGGTQVLFDPASWRRRMPTGDPARDRREGRVALIAIADSVRVGRGRPRSPLSFRSTPHAAPVLDDELPPRTPFDHSSYRVLVLGSNRRLGVLIEQFAEYTEQYEELDLELTIVDPDLPEDLASLVSVRTARPFAMDSIRTERRDFSQWEVMRDLLAGGSAVGRAFDSVVLLSEDWGDDEVGVDARVVLGLVMLRGFRSDPRWTRRLQGTSVVAEILDPSNRGLFEAEELVTDVIVSNQYVSRFAAQVAHDIRVEDLYRDLFDFGGSEIYTRPATDYIPQARLQQARFVDLLAAAGRRGEVALGFLRGEGDDTEPVIAPDAHTLLTGATGVLVIAED